MIAEMGIEAGYCKGGVGKCAIFHESFLSTSPFSSVIYETIQRQLFTTDMSNPLFET